MKHLFLPVAMATVLSAAAGAQGPSDVERAQDLAGPRVRVTAIFGSLRQKLKVDHGIDVAPMITQFGWQTEQRFASQPGGFTGVSEVVLLVGGMEQGQFLPSA